MLYHGLSLFCINSKITFVIPAGTGRQLLKFNRIIGDRPAALTYTVQLTNCGLTNSGTIGHLLHGSREEGEAAPLRDFGFPEGSTPFPCPGSQQRDHLGNPVALSREGRRLQLKHQRALGEDCTGGVAAWAPARNPNISPAIDSCYSLPENTLINMKTYKGFEEAGKHVTNIEELTTRDCGDRI